MAEHRLSLAVNAWGNLLDKKLITCRTVDRAAAGRPNGQQVTAGSVAMVGLGSLDGTCQFFGATHRAVV